MTQTITVPFKQLKKIYHVADIHIRLFKRHKEYREAFDTLFDIWSKEDMSESVIVVAGDVVHSKTDLSPEMVELASYFLRRCAELAPTLLIAGNHDMNLANTNRLDALTPICANIQNSNLHYLKYSGVYSVADVDFTVWSLLGDKADWPSITYRAIAPLQLAPTVCLFHGPVDKATTDVGYVVSNRSMDVSVFDGFDMVLLGDIHRQQTLQEYDPTTGKPIVVYPGSLIQQNHGEGPKGHGWAVWDVATRSAQFHELPNRFGYYTLRVENGKVPDYSDMPNNVRLRIFAGSLEQSDIKKLVATIRKKHTIEELAVTNFEGVRRTDGSVGTGNKFLDVHDVQFQNKLIGDYLRDALPSLSQDTLEKVYDLNKKMNDEVSKDDLARKIVWKPLSLKFDNLFTYGEGNEIDFTTMRGVQGIFAPNASGKTSIAEAICFALYDRTPRTTKAVNIMNHRKDSCSLEFKFEIDGKQYVIERKGKKNKKGEVKIDVDFYLLEPNGTRTSLNGEERRYTNQNIREYVGDFEDFLLTTFSSSSQTGLFVDRGQSDRKDLLSQFMGLNIFDKLHTLANEEAKDVIGALKRFKADDFTQDLVHADNQISKLDEEISLAEIDLEEVNATLNDYTTMIQNWYAEKVPLKPMKDIRDVEFKKAEVTTKSAELTSSMRQADEELIKVRHTLDRAKEKMATEYANFEEEYRNFQIKCAHLSEFHVKHKLNIESGERLKKELARLREHKYDPNCEFCVLNGKATIDRIAEIEAENERFAPIHAAHVESLARQDAEIAVEKPQWEEKAKKYKLGQEFIKTTEQKERQLELQIEQTKRKIEQGVSLLEMLNRDIEEYRASEEAIKKNAELDDLIRKAEATKQTHKTQFTLIQQTIRGKHAERATWEQKKQDMLARIKEAEELETKYEVYEAYLAAVCRDGLPYKMIAEVLPELQVAVNNILNQMVEFSLLFDMDGKNVNMRLSYDDQRTWPLELASGMEKFISGLAIRVALTSLSSLPKSNFLIIDEGLGALDGDNLSSLFGLFDVLRTHFDFMLLISHVDSVRDVSDRLLEIKRTDGFSQIMAV